MSVKVISQNKFNGGLSISDKEGIPGSFRSGFGINVHDEPFKFSALPGSVNVLRGKTSQAGGVNTNVQTGSIKWIVSASPWLKAVFAYDENGTLYQENDLGSWNVVRQVSASVGQGLGVYNNYLYYMRNQDIGRYGPLNGSPTFTDSWASGLGVTIVDTSVQGFAPVLAFGKGIAFGHGSNLAWFDGTTLTGQRLVFPPQALVRSMCRIEQYLMIGTIGSTNVFDNEEGFVFAWDGFSVSFNYFNNIDQGSNNCLVNYHNQPLSVNGTSGRIYLGIDPFTKVHQLPGIPITGSCQVYPGAVTSWKGRVFIGFSATSSDPNFVRGLYGWGSKGSMYPDALTCDYTISTGNTGASVQITAAKGLGNALYIAWRDSDTFGVDKVINTNTPIQQSRINFLIFDDKRIPQDKNADTIRVDHSVLRPGESISIYARTNRIGDYQTPRIVHTYSANDTKSNETRWRPDSGSSRFQEFEWGVGISCLSGTSPEIYGVSLKYDDLASEVAI